MLSIQEMVDKTVEQRKAIEHAMDATGSFHPLEASILNSPVPSDYQALKESLHNIPLREFLAKSGSTGIMGAAYLVPDKIHDVWNVVGFCFCYAIFFARLRTDLLLRRFRESSGVSK